MTTPLGATQSYPLTPGTAPLLITDGGNAPAGLQLVNRGDNGGTVWIMAGPAGQAAAVPLGPGASMQWTDTASMPYAYLSTAAVAAETLVVTGQSTNYSNPTVVAAATAAQLAAQGVPNVFTDANLGTYKLGATVTSTPINVSPYGSLVINVNWPAPPATNAAVWFTFDDPAIPDMPPITLWGSSDNVTDNSGGTWVLPVLAPRLQIKNVVGGTVDAWVTVVGNNRAAPGFRQLGAESGVYSIGGSSGGTRSQLTGTSGNTSRFNGAVTVVVNATGSGNLLMQWVDRNGTTQNQQIPAPVGMSITTVGHPSVPVSWWYTRTGTTGGGIGVTVTNAGA